MEYPKITLEACRVNTGMTQKSWAAKIGVTLQTVSNWELGKSQPTLSQIRIISELSGIPMDFIYPTVQSN